jgi:hypothetical protein
VALGQLQQSPARGSSLAELMYSNGLSSFTQVNVSPLTRRAPIQTSVCDGAASRTSVRSAPMVARWPPAFAQRACASSQVCAP